MNCKRFSMDPSAAAGILKRKSRGIVETDAGNLKDRNAIGDSVHVAAGFVADVCQSRRGEA